MAPPPLTPKPLVCLPSSPLPVRSPVLVGRLSLLPPQPMDTEAAITPPLLPPSPMEIASPPPPSLPSDGAWPGRFSTGHFPRPPTSNSGSRVDSAPWQFRCAPPQLRHPWVPPPAIGSHTQ
ncbi:uncharacterized protein LOC126455511 [Schistocerca serialis cubense]|uniref:uncharacterized protein LOC126455511 n=1 Tax=Schistocerca serialis cubense TaxID=2023355 RepID=UPI00214EF2D2|nr:uncharacterized protein LOC126455511 [Schistocerca serialis cubense]